MLHVLLKVVQMVNDRTETAASVLERSVLGINSNLFSTGRMKHSLSPRHTKGSVTRQKELLQMSSKVLDMNPRFQNKVFTFIVNIKPNQ